MFRISDKCLEKGSHWRHQLDSPPLNFHKGSQLDLVSNSKFCFPIQTPGGITFPLQSHFMNEKPTMVTMVHEVRYGISLLISGQFVPPRYVGFTGNIWKRATFITEKTFRHCSVYRASNFHDTNKIHDCKSTYSTAYLFCSCDVSIYSFV